MMSAATRFQATLLALALGAAGVLASSPAEARSDRLARFHARLVRLEAGAVRHVHVLQIGDSHTASDHFTGRLRSLLQQRFGNGGRGYLPPGVPHDHYRPHQVRVTQSGPWQLLTSNKSQPDTFQFGLAGIAMRTRGAARMTIEDRAGTETAWLEVHFMPRTDGGSLDALVDGTSYGRFDTREHSPALIRLDGRGRQVELRSAGDGPVDLTGLRHVAYDPGVVVSNLGFIGAQMSIMGRWRWPNVTLDIASLDPALIIVAFGTNEGFAPAERMERVYAREVSRRLAALAEAAPDAALVVVGPPDANRYPRFCLPPPRVVWQKLPATRDEEAPDPAARREPEKPPSENGAAPGRVVERPAEETRAPQAGTEEPRGASPGENAQPAPPSSAGEARAPERATQADAPPEADAKPGWRRRLVWADPPADAACRPLQPEERRNYDDLVDAKDRRLCRWHTPAGIAVVRRIQRDAALRHGALFFDWAELFEGECGADAWARRGLAHKDRVHFKPEGYAAAADRLHAALLAGYGKAR